jgi:hypothetical protein
MLLTDEARRLIVYGLFAVRQRQVLSLRSAWEYRETRDEKIINQLYKLARELGKLEKQSLN